MPETRETRNRHTAADHKAQEISADQTQDTESIGHHLKGELLHDKSSSEII